MIARHLAGVLLLLAAIGCAGSSSSATSGDPAAIVDTTWRLLQLGETPLIVKGDAPWPTLILKSSEKLAQGMAGCNRFSGSYELEGRSLRFGALMTTRMACPLLETETAYLSALEGTRSWSLVDGRLELLDGNAKPLARFEVSPKTP